MPILKVKGIELYYEEYGEGDRYVIQAQQFINSHLNYVKDLAEKEGFHAYIIRIRGYAPSTLITEDLGESWYDVWAQDVCDFADAMGIDKFFYTGHSHGAGIGWHLCVNHPERLRGFFASAAGPHKKDGQATGGARMETINAAKSPGDLGAVCEEAGRLLRQVFRAGGERSCDRRGGKSRQRADDSVLD